MNAIDVKEAIRQLQACPLNIQLMDESAENVIAFIDKGTFVQVRTSPLPRFEADVEEE